MTAIRTQPRPEPRKPVPIPQARCAAHGDRLRYSPALGVHCPSCETSAFVALTLATTSARKGVRP